MNLSDSLPRFCMQTSTACATCVIKYMRPVEYVRILDFRPVYLYEDTLTGSECVSDEDTVFIDFIENISLIFFPAQN